jgi:hypothetical protein
MAPSPRRWIRAILVGAIPGATARRQPTVFFRQSGQNGQRMDTTNAYRLARVGGGGNVRAEALRASRLYHG